MKKNKTDSLFYLINFFKKENVLDKFIKNTGLNLQEFIHNNLYRKGKYIFNTPSKSFSWDCSKEGYSFWYKYYIKYETLIDNETIPF